MRARYRRDLALSRRRGDQLRIEGFSDPDDPNAEVWESGALLPGPGATLAGPTFEEWLQATVRVA